MQNILFRHFEKQRCYKESYVIGQIVNKSRPPQWTVRVLWKINGTAPNSPENLIQQSNVMFDFDTFTKSILAKKKSLKFINKSNNVISTHSMPALFSACNPN